MLKDLPTAIIDACHDGLAAAAHLAMRNQPFIIFEPGDDKAFRQLLEGTNWKAPYEEGLPTGEELYKQYLKPLEEHTSMHRIFI